MSRVHHPPPLLTRGLLAALVLSLTPWPALAQVEVGANDVRISHVGVDGDQVDDAFAARVAYNPIEDEYLVAYSRGQTLLADLDFCEILAQRVDGAGGMPVGPPAVVGSHAQSATPIPFCLPNRPAVVHNPDRNEYLVVWMGRDDGAVMKARRLDGSTGQPIAPEMIIGSGFGGVACDAAWNSARNEYLVVWAIGFSDFYNGIYGQRLDTSGQQIGTDFRIDLPQTPNAFGVALAHNSVRDQYLVLWSTEPDGPTSDVVRGQRLNGTGGLIGPNDFLLNAVTGEAREEPDLVHDASRDEYMVVLRGTNAGARETLGMRLDGATAAPLGGGEFVIGPAAAFGAGRGPAISRDGVHDTYLVAWIGEVSPGEPEVVGRTMSSSGATPGPVLRLSDMGTDGMAYLARDAAVAFNPLHDEHLVVWTGQDGGGALLDAEHEIYGQRVGDAECFLVIGPASGESLFAPGVHAWQTQVASVEDFYPVLLDDIPEFVLPTPLATERVAGAPGVAGVGLAHGDPFDVGSPPWMADGHFAVQVVMWNPEVFPSQPEQYTAGLHVVVLPNGAVRAIPYGADLGGMEIGFELDTNAEGEPVIRFPFSIPGF